MLPPKRKSIHELFSRAWSLADGKPVTWVPTGTLLNTKAIRGHTPTYYFVTSYRPEGHPRSYRVIAFDWETGTLSYPHSHTFATKPEAQAALEQLLRTA